MIQSTWGGTHAESWTSMEVMKDDTLYSDVLQLFALKNVKRNKDYCKVPSTLWNGMIAPIAGYTVRGNIGIKENLILFVLKSISRFSLI